MLKEGLPERAVAEEPTGDFNIEIIEEGTGELCPSGAQITAHYHGTLEDGTVFDSSVKRGQPFECTIGVGQVIKGWDIGFTKMKKGSKAVLTCPPSFAYGPNGYPPVIPPNATLKFEVELLDFKK